MKSVLDIVFIWFAIIFICAIYLSQFDQKYKEKCLGSTFVCVGVFHGRVIADISEGYKIGTLERESDILAVEVAQELKKNNSQRK